MHDCVFARRGKTEVVYCLYMPSEDSSLNLTLPVAPQDHSLDTSFRPDRLQSLVTRSK